MHVVAVVVVVVAVVVVVDVVVVYPHLPALWEVSAHSTEVAGSTVFCSHQDLGVMVSSFRALRQCLSFSGKGRPVRDNVPLLV